MKQEQFLSVVDRDEAERRFHSASSSPDRSRKYHSIQALGRVLAEDLFSGVDVPPSIRSNVDGCAVQAADKFGASEASPRHLRHLPEKIMTGAVPSGTVTPGTAMAIPTGGVVPRGADAIVMVEYSRLIGDMVIVDKSVTPERAVTYAGTDVAESEVVLRACNILTSR